MLKITGSMAAKPNGTFIAVSGHPWVTDDRLFTLQSDSSRPNSR